MEPSLENAKWGWNKELNKAEEFYRNKLVLSNIIFEPSDF